MSADTCIVSSYNEWDPLEEVIVGDVEGAVLPAWDTINRCTVPPGYWDDYASTLVGGKGNRYPAALTDAGAAALRALTSILEGEGVIVKRPDVVKYDRPFSTPDWSVGSGFCAANPRDLFLVLGDEIIEAPMADRSRYFESWAYRSLLKSYARAGARWTAAPKPQLLDQQYDAAYRPPRADEATQFVLTEFEPTFDAADFIRCGRDIFAQLSHVTNRFGVEWLQRHVGDRYTIHLLPTRNPRAIHLDTTFMPLAPGKALVNPEYVDVDNVPPLLKRWDLLVPPLDGRAPGWSGLVSRWIGINVLSIDSERVIVEKSQGPLIRALKDWGFRPIPCPFADYYPFAGSIHCATLDVRRRGTLESYF